MDLAGQEQHQEDHDEDATEAETVISIGTPAVSVASTNHDGDENNQEYQEQHNVVPLQ